MDATEALIKLKEGNARFVVGNASAKNLVSQRQTLVSGQKPFAIILTCSDSRVSPEHIFDASLGEIFVVRTAGNIADAIALGSIEYAAEHLGSQLLVIMGHESCGAVKAACGADHAPGNIDAIVKELQPAVSAGGKDVNRTIEENIKLVIANARKKSSALSHMEKEGKLKVVGAVYSLSSGNVN
jgi:carbonic anhydrase